MSEIHNMHGKNLLKPPHLSELTSRVVTFADTEGGEPEPVREDAPALIAGVEGEQSLEPVLLLTPAAWPAEHLVVLGPADLHVDVLLEGVEVEEGQGVVPGVVGPVGGRDALLHLTGISRQENGQSQALAQQGDTYTDSPL